MWGAALALAVWWPGVRCLRDMAKTLLKVMGRVGVSPVTFLRLHLSAFWSSVHSATATKLIGECWHLKNEEPDWFWCSAFKLIFIFRCPVLKDLVQDCNSNCSVKLQLNFWFQVLWSCLHWEAAYNLSSIRDGWNLLGIRMVGICENVLSIYISTMLSLFQTWNIKISFCSLLYCSETFETVTLRDFF